MTSQTHRAVRSLLDTGALDLPDPGSGSTPVRLQELCAVARRSPVGVARLAEAHTDAIAILHEAHRRPLPGALYGVWASQTTTKGVVYDAARACVSGAMGFASGLDVVDRALVTAHTDGGIVLIDVDVDVRKQNGPTVATDITKWESPALIDTATGPVTFVDHPVSTADVVGEPGWYLDRVGFWQGACAPAACWAGGALGLIDAAARYVDDDPHRRAHHGALVAHEWVLTSLLDAAGRQIDAEPDSAEHAELVARSLRFAVTDICRDVMDRFGRSLGPRPYVADGHVAQRVIDLDLYIKQHHGERELAEISDLVTRER